jgi:hypothetical protein
MARFVTYDPEVAARLSQAVGMHRVELRAGTDSPRRKVSPALLDAIASRERSAVLMPASDEQVLLVHVNDNSRENPMQDLRKRKRTAKQNENNVTEIGSRPSGFLGLHDESVFSDEQEDPPRSLWKQDE